MLVKTAIMLKSLETRRMKTFGDALVGGLVIDKVKIKLYKFSSDLANLRNTPKVSSLPAQNTMCLKMKLPRS